MQHSPILTSSQKRFRSILENVDLSQYTPISDTLFNISVASFTNELGYSPLQPTFLKNKQPPLVIQDYRNTGWETGFYDVYKHLPYKTTDPFNCHDNNQHVLHYDPTHQTSHVLHHTAHQRFNIGTSPPPGIFQQEDPKNQQIWDTLRQYPSTNSVPINFITTERQQQLQLFINHVTNDSDAKNQTDTVSTLSMIPLFKVAIGPFIFLNESNDHIFC